MSPRSRRVPALLALAVLVPLAIPARAGATTLTDPIGDFLPSYAGPHDADLDVASVAVSFDGTSFQLTGTMAGAIGTTPGAIYVWGLDRGKGTQRFLTGSPSIGAGVSFDSVLVLRPDGTGSFSDFIAGTTAALPSADISIDGNTITADLSLSFAPSEGFAPGQYGFNLWPRSGLGRNDQVADFAPDASAFQATVPEPASIALLGMALAGMLGLRRRVAREDDRCTAG